VDLFGVIHPPHLKVRGAVRVLPILLNPLRRKIKQVSADGTYDTQAYHALLQKKGLAWPSDGFASLEAARQWVRDVMT